MTLYSKPTFKQMQIIRKYLKDINEVALFFQDYFIDKHVDYIYDTNKITTVSFLGTNFAHLCGIKYKHGAKNFFRAAQKNKIDLSCIEIKNDGSTVLKLMVLKDCNTLINPGVVITSDGIVSTNFSYEKSILTKTMFMALVIETSNNLYYPQSIINLGAKTVKSIPTHTYMVEHIVSRELETEDYRLIF